MENVQRGTPLQIGRNTTISFFNKSLFPKETRKQMALTIKEKFTSRAIELFRQDEQLIADLKLVRKAVCDEALANFKENWLVARENISEFIRRLAERMPVYLSFEQRVALLPGTIYSDAMARVLCKLLQDIIDGSVLVEQLPFDILWEIVRQLDWKSIKSFYRAFVSNPRMRLILQQVILRQDSLLIEFHPETRDEALETWNNQLLLISRTLFWTLILSSSAVTISFVRKDGEGYRLGIFELEFTRKERQVYFTLNRLRYYHPDYDEQVAVIVSVINTFIKSVYKIQFFNDNLWKIPIGPTDASYSFVVRLLQEFLHIIRKIALRFGVLEDWRLRFEKRDIVSVVAHHSSSNPIVNIVTELSEREFPDAFLVDLPKLTVSTMDSVDREIVEFFSKQSDALMLNRGKKYQRLSQEYRLLRDAVEIQLFWFDHHRCLKMLDISNLDESEQLLRNSQMFSTFPRVRALFGLASNMCLMPINLPGNPLQDMPGLLDVCRVLYYFEKRGKGGQTGRWDVFSDWSERDYILF
jgi:hypothetical protein